MEYQMFLDPATGIEPVPRPKAVFQRMPHRHNLRGNRFLLCLAIAKGLVIVAL